MRITVVGSINLDLVATARQLPAPGETVTGATLARHPGGKGANQALAAERLGAEVCLIGRVGDDAMAGEALALMEDLGVDLAGVEVDVAAPTGVALIAVDPAGENQIVVAAGANHMVTPEQLPQRIEGALIVQLELPIETVEAAVGRATGFVCANLAPAAPVSERLLRRADLIVVNETEAPSMATACTGAAAGWSSPRAPGARPCISAASKWPGRPRRPSRRSMRRARATPSSPPSRWLCLKAWTRPKRCASPAPPGRSRRPARAPNPRRRSAIRSRRCWRDKNTRAAQPVIDWMHPPCECLAGGKFNAFKREMCVRRHVGAGRHLYSGRL